jgi:hypothetical protein
MKFVPQLLTIVLGLLLIVPSESTISHAQSNPLPNKPQMTENMKNSELAIIADIKKGCELLLTHKTDSLKLLTSFGTIKTEGYVHTPEIKPFNNDLERIYFGDNYEDKALSFETKDSTFISIEVLKQEFGVPIVYLPSRYNAPRRYIFKYDSPSLTSPEYYKISATAYMSKIYNISVSISTEDR